MSTARHKASVMNHPVVITFLILAVIATMSLASEVLKPLALSILLAFALSPIARFLEKLRLPRAVAVGLTLLLALGSLGGMGYVVGKQMSSLLVHLPEYKDRIQAKVDLALNPEQGSALKKAEGVVKDVSKSLSQRPICVHRRDGRPGDSGADVPRATTGGGGPLPGISSASRASCSCSCCS